MNGDRIDSDNLGRSVSSKARITAIGSYTPERRLTNEDLEKMVDTSDEWIVQRTGIRERRIVGTDEWTSDMAGAAVEDLMKRFDKSVEDVDLILVATTTPDFAYPSVSEQIQARFGIRNTGAIDISAACAGFTYGLHLANGVITAGLNRKVLVIGAEALSKVTDYTDRTACILFGDGAGAVLVEYDENRPGFRGAHLGSQGEAGAQLYRTVGMAEKIGEMELVGSGKIVQNGREVYKWAVTTVPEGMNKAAENSGLDFADIDWFVPHSANLRMIESICEKSGFPIEKTLYSLEYFGQHILGIHSFGP
jgi:3-oxoacyl-[acyl-carrier-protein] synthase-3